MTDICFAFEVHQPYRLKKDFFWNREMLKRRSKEELFDYYFSGKDNEHIFKRICEKCYFPANSILLEAIEERKKERRPFKVTFSLSGIFIEQCERFAPDLLDSFKQLASTGCCEFLSQTNYHSLSSLYDDSSEFIEQVGMHREAMKDLFGQEPKIFENTELIFNNALASLVENLGYEGIFTEGIERVLGWRSPNYLYTAKGSNIKVLMRNYKLTDDVGFRFSSRDWEEYPLTADKYASWLASAPGDCINLFADYETFGEHHWVETGILEFLRHLPGEVLKWDHLSFATPSEIVDRYPAVGEIDAFEFGNTVSWADLERDLSCWLGNTMQWACYTHHRDMLPMLKGDNELLRIWRYLGSSDHLYYMFTAGGGPGEVHSYFSHYNTPYDAFITLQSVLSDFDSRVRRHMRCADEPFVFSKGEDIFLQKAYGLVDFPEVLKQVELESIEFHAGRGDFEAWVRESLHDDELAGKIGRLSKKKSGEDLKKSLIKTFKKRREEVEKHARI